MGEVMFENREDVELVSIDVYTNNVDCLNLVEVYLFFFFQAEDGIRDVAVTGVQTCALPISPFPARPSIHRRPRPDHRCRSPPPPGWRLPSPRSAYALWRRRKFPRNGCQGVSRAVCPARAVDAWSERVRA